MFFHHFARLRTRPAVGSRVIEERLVEAVFQVWTFMETLSS